MPSWCFQFALARLLLAKAGLLDGLAATTHHGAMDLLRETAPHTTTQMEKRFVDNGRIMTSAGVPLALICRFTSLPNCSAKEPPEAARQMEYNWNPQ